MNRFEGKVVIVTGAGEHCSGSGGMCAMGAGIPSVPRKLQWHLQRRSIRRRHNVHKDVAKQFKQWNGKIVVDLTNALRVAPEKLGGLLSSEIVSQAFVGARLAKAFNHLPAAQLGMNPSLEGQRQVVFVSSNDADASATVCDELWLRALVETAVTYGWRVGELLHLRVRQVDLVGRTVRLEPGETKNREGREVVIASSMLLELLRQCLDGKDQDDHVFTRGDKQVRDFRRSWANLCTAWRARTVIPRPATNSRT